MRVLHRYETVIPPARREALRTRKAFRACLDNDGGRLCVGELKTAADAAIKLSSLEAKARRAGLEPDGLFDDEDFLGACEF